MKKILLLTITVLLFAFVACDKDETSGISVKKGEYTLHYEDEVQIEATSSLNVNYTSESNYVAKVSVSGLITAGRVGKTSIILSNSEGQTKVIVNVVPLYNLFPEPIHKISFDASKQKVKEIFGVPAFENSAGIAFDNYHLNYDYMFTFDGDNMQAMAVVIPTLSLPENIAAFLLERYQIMALEGYTAGFVNEKQDMAVAFTPSSDYLSTFVMYLPFSPTGRATNNTNLADTALNILQSLLQESKR